MKLWIARRKSSRLYMFFEKPYLTEDGKQWFVLKNIPNNGVFVDTGIKIDEYKFPEVTFENSPMEVEIKLIEK